MVEVKLPKTSDDVLESVIVFWHKSEGDTVKEGDVLVEVQTEKAVFEVEAEANGILKEIIVPRGEVAVVGDVLATITPEVIDKAIDGVEPTEPKEQSESRGKDTSFVRVAPRIRKLAKDLGVDLLTIQGTGRNGTPTEDDVRQAASGQVKEYDVVSYSKTRQTIAKRMINSLQSSAQLTETAWANVTNLAEVRDQLKTKYSWNHFIFFAVINALKEHRNLNAHIFDEELHQFKKVHLGIAVDSNEELLVPVLKNADELSLFKLKEESDKLIEKAKARKLSSDQLSGSTFTISNLGTYGIQFFTPILNPPEAAILGVGSMETDLMLQEGRVVERLRIPLSLTFDHRAIDGLPAAKFLNSVITYLEKPAQLFDSIPENFVTL
jgi:pyruvate dehydrogenase E2 component (dihydrolipoamide acetyltransferase)